MKISHVQHRRMKIQTNDWNVDWWYNIHRALDIKLAIIILIEIGFFIFQFFFSSSIQDYGDQQSIVTNGNSPYRPTEQQKKREEVIIGKFQHIYPPYFSGVSYKYYTINYAQ